MPTDTAMYSVDNQTMQLYMELLDPHLSLNDVLNVTAYAVMSCGKDQNITYWILIVNLSWVASEHFGADHSWEEVKDGHSKVGVMIRG